MSMEIKLFDSELKVMEIVWREGALPAGKIAQILKEEIGWSRNTTYTVIKKCIEKKAIERQEPHFICKALVTKESVQMQETDELIEKMFDGSAERFFTAFLSSKKLSDTEVEKLKQMIDRMK